MSLMENYKDIIYEKKNKVARITINRPQVYNAFGMTALVEMTDAFRDASDDQSVRVIVLMGKGDKAFCTGGDVSEEKEFSVHIGRKYLSMAMTLSAEMRNSPKPIIAAVKGYCVGGGNELNLLCDLTIAADNAKFGQAGPRVGSVPVWGGTQLMPRLVGDKRAKEIVFLCRLYSAQEALQMGWINRVVPLEKLEEEVQKWCEELIAKSPNSLKIAKVSINFESDLLYASFVHGAALINLMHGTEEFKEGMQAFLEKRKPDFEKYHK
jgi:dihydroxynaphthoic acid synthetase